VIYNVFEKEYLSKMWVGDPKHQREVFNERFQKAITCGMGMQIPSGLVSEVSIQDIGGGDREIGSGYHQATMQLEGCADFGRQCAKRPYPFGVIDTPKVFCFKVCRFSEGKECDQDIRYASCTEEAVLGRHFWSKRYCVATVGLNEEQIKKYVRWKLKRDKIIDQLKLWKE
jgi:hypothetical protein